MGLSEPTMALEQFAALTALIDVGRPRHEVLEAARLTPQAWSQAQAVWLSKLAQQARLRRFELQTRFNELLLGFLRGLEEGQSIEIGPDRYLGKGGEPVVRIAATSSPAPIAASSPPPGAAEMPPAPAPPIVVPSWSRGAAEGTSSDTAPPPRRPAEPAPIAVPAASVLPFSAGERARPSSAPKDDGALPFGPPRHEESANDGTRARFSATADLERLAVALPAGASLPFLDGRVERTAPPAREVALPFRAAGKKVTPLPAPLAVDPGLAGTVTVGAERTPPRLTLEQFASLEAELAFHPERGDEVRSRYRMDARELSDERGRWARCFLDDLELGRRYREKLAEFKLWLQRKE